MEHLDRILALQFTVAWAGEGRCQPKRLGWWETDLIDEQVNDRLAAHKREGATPADALPLPMKLTADIAKDALASALTADGTDPHTVVPGGRQLRGGAPEDAAVLVLRLAAGLVPLTEQYPLPFFKVKA